VILKAGGLLPIGLGICQAWDESTAKNPLWSIFSIIFVKYGQCLPQMIKKMGSK